MNCNSYFFFTKLFFNFITKLLLVLFLSFITKLFEAHPGSATRHPSTPSKPSVCPANAAAAIVFTLLGARGYRPRTWGTEWIGGIGIMITKFEAKRPFATETAWRAQLAHLGVFGVVRSSGSEVVVQDKVLIQSSYKQQ